MGREFSCLAQWLGHCLGHLHPLMERLGLRSGFAPDSSFLLVHTLTGSAGWLIAPVAQWRLQVNAQLLASTCWALAVTVILGSEMGDRGKGRDLFLNKIK